MQLSMKEGINKMKDFVYEKIPKVYFGQGALKNLYQKN